MTEKTKHKTVKKAAKPGKHAKPAKKAKAAEKPAEGKDTDRADVKPAAKKADKALILSFRRGRHTQKTNQFLLEIEGADTRAKASQYIGSRVVWTSPGKLEKKIYGKITTTHGNNGVLRARFRADCPALPLAQRSVLCKRPIL